MQARDKNILILLCHDRLHNAHRDGLRCMSIDIHIQNLCTDQLNWPTRVKIRSFKKPLTSDLLSRYRRLPPSQCICFHTFIIFYLNIAYFI